MKKTRNAVIFLVILLALAGICYYLSSSKPEGVKHTASVPVQLKSSTFYLYYPYDTGTAVAIKEVTAMANLGPTDKPMGKIAELLKKAPTSGPEELAPVLGPNAEILSVEVKDEIVTVNLNQAFVTEMNAGSGLEGTIIKCLVKTLTRNYHAKGVLIRVEGKPYESGHYAFRPTEIIYPDTDL